MAVASPKCFFAAWIAGWVVAIFLPSVLVASFGLSEPAATLGTGLHRLPAISFKVADDVGPVVKLMLGGMLLACFLGVERARLTRSAARYSTHVAAGILATIVTIIFVPDDYSRGFAARLTGARFDGATLPLYLLGGAFAGAAFALSLDRCRRNNARRADVSAVS